VPSRSPSGPGFDLAAGPYAATVRSVGASLQRLRAGGRDLVLPFGDDEMRPFFRGAVLAPWPNRVIGGRWRWQDADLELPLTEPARGHALHGLVAWLAWTPVEHTTTTVALSTTVWPQPGYPFCLDLEARCTLDPDDGLLWELRAVNAGQEPAPYGCGIHPYLVAPAGTVDDWRLHLPARSELLTDDRLAPTTLAPVGPEHDFRTARPVGDAQVDNAFTDVAFDGGEASATVLDADGVGARLTFGPTTPWVQVCTSDWRGEPGYRAGLAVEPMTCPPDALRSGTDLVVLDAGEAHRTWWRIAAVRP
jgi:aldose 1-epimerase